MTHSEYLTQIDSVIENGKYKANWASLCNHKTPDWYYHDKLGVFIHWGIYSVPAFGNEWYSRSMYDKSVREFEHHRKTYGNQKDFGYKDFIPMFKAENFDASRWVSTFKDAGIKYVMPVCEHHDGFAMYDTEFNKWNASKMGPCRNVVGEIKAECDKQGLTFCASTHRAEHYFFMNLGRTFDSDVNDDDYRDFYGPAYYCDELNSKNLGITTENPFTLAPTIEWLEDWLVRTCELIDKYQPRVLYFDWWIQNHAFKPYLKKLCAYYYNRADEWGVEVTINYKHEAFPPTVATFDVERGALTDISPIPWQTDTAIGLHSWGYVKDNKYKHSRQIICDFVDIVSKNGMLLLNIGPKPDGTFTDEETQVLTDLGSWLKINGEGIYGTCPWKKFGEGDTNNQGGYFSDSKETEYCESDFRFTYKNGYLYAFQMRPNGKIVKIKSLNIKNHRDILLGEITNLGDIKIESIDRDENALTITLAEAPKTDLPICFKIEIE